MQKTDPTPEYLEAAVAELKRKQLAALLASHPVPDRSPRLTAMHADASDVESEEAP